MNGTLAIAAVAVALAAGCSRAQDESGTKRSPVAPPPNDVTVPADLRIPVTVDGASREPVTAATLTARPPDYRDDDRRAWRLVGLIPELAGDGASVEARGNQGVTVRMDMPPGKDGPQPVLFLTRRGEMVATLVDPAEPFPGYHGQGGRLRRPGDTMPHVSPVLELAVLTKR